MMVFNAWRLNTMYASSKFVLSDQCVSRKQLRQARYRQGKTYESFMKQLFDGLKLPPFLRHGETEIIDDTLSPQRPTTNKKVTYQMWAEDEDWVRFRTSAHSGHVPSNINQLVRQMFLPNSSEKRKRNSMEQNCGNDDNELRENELGESGLGTQPIAPATDGEYGMEQTEPSTPVKKFVDKRKWCFRCSYKIYERVDGRRIPKNVSRFPGSVPRKTSIFCMRCRVALCQACFRPWHDDKSLGITPTESEVNQEVLGEV
jgi:hypothetical protein